MACSRGLAVGVQSANDVVAVQPQVEGEVVARPGRDDDHGDTALGGHAGDQCLGPVAARHADDVDAPVDGVARELEQIVAPGEDDRLDPSRATFVLEVEALGLSATRLEVHDQGASPRGGHGRARCGAPLEGAHVAGERIPGDADRDGQQRQPQQQERPENPSRANSRATIATIAAAAMTSAAQRRPPVRVSASQAARVTTRRKASCRTKASGSLTRR